MDTSQRLKQWLLDPVLVIGSLISVGAGLALYASDQGEFSLLVGLLLLVITLQIQSALDSKGRVHKDTLYGQTVAAFEEHSWLSSDVRRMLRLMPAAAQRFGNTPFQATCRVVFERARADFGQLAEGRIMLPYHRNKDFAAGTMRDARRTLQSVTVEGPDPVFWRSPTGRQYLEAQKAAVARGVRIDRVIVYRAWSPKLDAVAREQVAAGMNVYRVEASRLSSDLRVSQAVWDGVAGFVTEVNAAGEPISYRFTIVEDDVAEILERFRNVWALREELPAKSADMSA
ncbi:hypothetical protein K1W54_00485 [Micromonospora sp. CPCC 205371]|nr:hypothetical protein [Micromonospora sp. CPCC 205371]